MPDEEELAASEVQAREEDQGQEQPTISGNAGQCLSAFQLCLLRAAAVHPRELSLVEDQLARFSIWTSSLGVFARGRASMDHRLAEAPDVHDAVMGLLEAVADRIQTCLDALESITEPRKEGDDGTPTTVLRALKGVADDISLLYRISNTIRRASKQAQNHRAARSYRIKDEDGNDAEELLLQVFNSYLLGRFPTIQDGLRDRLASSMLIRRKRVLYRRSRYGKSPIQAQKTAAQPKVEIPKAQAGDIVELPGKHEEAIPSTKAIPTDSAIQSVAVSATTLAAEDYKNASAPSVISATRTVALANHEELGFPPPPNGRIRRRYKILKRQRERDHDDFLRSQLSPEQYEKYRRDSNNAADTSGLGSSGTKMTDETISHAGISLDIALKQDWQDCNKAIAEVICPFCFYALPSLSVSVDKKWHAHVVSDLDAYVCLFDECDKAEELFNHSSDWLNHMRGHTLRWRCTSKSHGTKTFLTEEQYLEHMTHSHARSFTNAQLRVLAERQARAIGPIFEFCPICGGAENLPKGELEEHVVGHLRFLALKSLPPYEDEASNISAGDGGASHASKPLTRSTIHKDPERHTKLSLTDEKPEPQGEYAIVIGDFYPSDDEDERRFLWYNDPSRSSVDLSVFAGIQRKDRRQFEWGFIPRTMAESPEDDPIIQAIKKAVEDKKKDNELFFKAGREAATRDFDELNKKAKGKDKGRSDIGDEEIPEVSDKTANQPPSLEGENESELFPDFKKRTSEEAHQKAEEVNREAMERDQGKSGVDDEEILEVSKKKAKIAVFPEQRTLVRGETVANPHDNKSWEPSSTVEHESVTDKTLVSRPSKSTSPRPSPFSIAPDSNISDANPIEPLPLSRPDSEGDNNERSFVRFHNIPTDRTPFDALDIAEKIARALRDDRSPPHAQTLIETLPGLRHNQLMEVRAEYKRIVKTGPDMKGVNVAKHIRARLKVLDECLTRACYATALGKWESEAYWVTIWGQSDKTRRELLIESLIGRTNSEIRAIKDSFSFKSFSFKDKKYQASLSTYILTELKNDNFRSTILMVLQERRMEEFDSGGLLIPIDRKLVKQDVEVLRKSVQKDTTGVEPTILFIIVSRSDSHLREVLKLYESTYENNFVREALEKCGNLAGETISHALNGVLNKPVRDALLLRNALYASREDELRRDLLTSRLIRFHWDPGYLSAIKRAYRERYRQDLAESVRDCTTGGWGLFCQQLVVGCIPHEDNEDEDVDENERVGQAKGGPTRGK